MSLAAPPSLISVDGGVAGHYREFAAVNLDARMVAIKARLLGAGTVDCGALSPRLLADLAGRPLWLAAIAVNIVGSVLQIWRSRAASTSESPLSC
jgi:hypothetical protein